MQIVRLKITNFRGISDCSLLLEKHSVLIGDNNSGKSTILEAMDLVLGPDRLSRAAPIDEHDFYGGRYIDPESKPIEINIEAVIIELTPEQRRHFKNNIEFWDTSSSSLVEGPVEAVATGTVKEALRVRFRGWYDADDDDFTAETSFCYPVREDGQSSPFRPADKRRCGFLLLRTLRTGSRALSLERGSLLDIILRVKELRPKMWEGVLSQLRTLPVADDPSLGVSDILTAVQDAIRKFVPADWGANPHLRVSDLTREHLRKTLTVFMATGAVNGTEPHSAPFQHQGTGTINMLVLALLSIIADAKKTVVFAMEEPEIAIPPSTQKRIVHGVREQASQAIFTSHSPYVLEEFNPSEIIVLNRDGGGSLVGLPVKFPPHIKAKTYSQEYRLRFAEALLARRVLIAEGETEALAYPAVARRLAELNPGSFTSLKALGVAVFNAQTDSQVAVSGSLFKGLGKLVFAVFDKQPDPASLSAIEAAVDYAYEAPTKGFEDLLLNETAPAALERYGRSLVSSGDWPTHLHAVTPIAGMPLADLKKALKSYLGWAKGRGGAADLLGQCSESEMPLTVRNVVQAIRAVVVPPSPSTPGVPLAPAPPASASAALSSSVAIGGSP